MEVDIIVILGQVLHLDNGQLISEENLGMSRLS